MEISGVSFELSGKVDEFGAPHFRTARPYFFNVLGTPLSSRIYDSETLMSMIVTSVNDRMKTFYLK